MLKTLAAIGLGAALLLSPVASMAQNAAAPDKPMAKSHMMMKKHMMKKHMMKKHMMKKHMMKKHMMEKPAAPKS